VKLLRVNFQTRELSSARTVKRAVNAHSAHNGGDTATEQTKKQEILLRSVCIRLIKIIKYFILFERIKKLYFFFSDAYTTLARAKSWRLTLWIASK